MELIRTVTHYIDSDGLEVWLTENTNYRSTPPLHEKLKSEDIRDYVIGGRVHRKGGSAITYPDGTEIWAEGNEFYDIKKSFDEMTAEEMDLNFRESGYWHRENGPAIVRPNGEEVWYDEGVPIKKEPTSQ